MAETLTEADSPVTRFGIKKDKSYHSTLLIMIEDLFEDGLETQLDPFPEDDRAFAKILDQLRATDKNDLESLLDISGWKLSPHGEDEMRCQECMYYLVHKRWCDLPELDLPAEPDWWCRLWRI